MDEWSRAAYFPLLPERRSRLRLPTRRSVASFEKSNRLLYSLPVFPKSKSEMEMGEGGEIDLGAAAHTTEASRE